ncbi:MAG: formimidoylglutamate deiminase [Xanthomonadaceae bacterium]|nr:formimidoylglutamate deiminase [Xanthomonadaceae bacterium]
MRKLTFKHALTPDGIVADCVFGIDEAGLIASVGHGGPPYDGDLALPGMPNAHSHAFQRALAGRGERRAGDDSFWSWRDAMYSLAARVTPEQLYAIAAQAYVEMLAAGFTSVAEFHYLHHLPDGSATTAMADAVIAAARDTGIRLRLLPVYYHAGGFGKPAGPGQRRFVHASVDAYLAFVDSLDHPHKGFAPHSLRAVPLEHLREILRESQTRSHNPLHIHISEQEAEVQQCMESHGARPIELLADSLDLNAQWTLVHATHADEGERTRILASGACVALCPLTEAYLGDGLFAAAAHHAAGGAWAIGSDSNGRIDAVEELRWLEYGQRLRDRRRARLADENGIGLPLWRAAAAGGTQATGFPVGRLEAGCHADLVVLSADASPWRGLPPERWLDAWVTGGSRHDIDAVFVGGDRVVQAGRHRDGERISVDFAGALQELAR